MTAPFRVAHAGAAEDDVAGGHWSALTRRCLAALAESGPAPTGDAGLGFVYVTDRLGGHLSEVVDHLRLTTGLRHWVGTVGIGILGNDGKVAAEYFDAPAMTVMIADLPANAFRLFEQQEVGTGAFTKQHGSWIESHGAQLGLVHGDPRSPRLPAILESLAASSGLYLVGGLASSRGPYALAADHVAAGGVSGAIFAGAVDVATGLSQGCSPIGPVHAITECDNNIVMTIDDRPALDVFKEEIGEILSRDLNRAAGYIFAALPVKASDTGDYLVRNLVGIDPNKGWIAIGDLVAKGDSILFTRRDKPSAETDLDRMLSRLKQRIGKPIRGGIYVSCLSRGPNLFGPDAVETRRITAALGDFPLVGFFANGEISHDRLYAHTGVLTLFT
ncbi:FIST signal transduction protein [Dongia sedimenti]|uniref:FIST N-terminal domain-containing protein n=1 Tax=Dongia sedimenti TaxID=3064282 RepID=A0ABU0YNH5_9PROT|nr:FIST N-terminal domain-containing protein [Rhodospirillaceae bacterium R-7]